MWVLSRGTKRMETLGMSSHPNGVSRLDFCDPCCGSFFLASWSLIASCLFLRLVLQSSLNPVGPLYPPFKLPFVYVSQRCFCCMQPKNLSGYNSTNALWVLTFSPIYQVLIKTFHVPWLQGTYISWRDMMQRLNTGTVTLSQASSTLLHILIFFLGFPDMLECSVSFSLHSMSWS